MLDILKFIFSDWKTFWGTILIITIIGEYLLIPICNTIIKSINGKYILKYSKENKESEDK